MVLISELNRLLLFCLHAETSIDTGKAISVVKPERKSFSFLRYNRLNEVVMSVHGWVGVCERANRETRFQFTDTFRRIVARPWCFVYPSSCLILSFLPALTACS